MTQSGNVFLEAFTPYKILKDRPLKIAVSPSLGDLPVDNQVLNIIKSSAETFKKIGAKVTYTDPPLEGAMEAFQIQRAVSLRGLGKMLDQSVKQWRDYSKDTTIWNIEKGFDLSIDDMIKAEVIRTNIYSKMSEFFKEFDLLLLPSAQVPPFNLSNEWVKEINGEKLETYIDWMSVCMISTTGLPAISIPEDSDENLPVGIQLVGKPKRR